GSLSVIVTASAPGMWRSAALNPSRTCTRASLPIWRIRRCSARPLPSASPSGLRCEVMRKLRPSRMRSATCCAARSGLVTWWILLQQRLDAAGARRGVVVLEIELGSVAKPDSSSQERADTTAPLLQRVDHAARFLLVQSADEDRREMVIGADFEFGEVGRPERDVLDVDAQRFDQRVAHVLAHS